MIPGEVSRYAALAIGCFQVVVNGALLLRGVARLPQELATEGGTTRIADLLRTAWVYGTLGNLCVRYYFAQTRHVGLLVFSGLGVALLATLWFGR